jgi:hypothetical protein
MNRILQLVALFLMTLGISCVKDLRELDKGSLPLALTADKSAIVLEQKNQTQDAIVLSWTPGSNQGTNAAISYTLKLDKKGNNFSSALIEPLGAGVRSKKFTVGELNTLATQFGIPAGTAAAFEAQIISSVADGLVHGDSTSVVEFLVTPFQPVSETLYLLGDATPNGWSADNATALTPVPAQPGFFSWKGILSIGEFKLITTLGAFLPSYNKGANEASLVYRTADADPDEKFSVTSSGLYDVVVSLLDGTISVTASSEPPYKQLWLLGDAVPTGWNIDNPTPMRVDSSNLFVFTYGGLLTAGEFKIPVATGNFETDYYMPLVNQQPLTETGVQLVPGGNPDNKWKVTNAGPYKIRLDLQGMTMQIQPFTPYTEIWMVGDATPAGWNIDNPVALVPTPGNPYEFSFTGPMTAGEFKFPLDTGNWGCDYFMPVINGSEMGSTQMKFIKSGSPDNKWRITQAGNYKITINQLYETIQIQKQ